MQPDICAVDLDMSSETHPSWLPGDDSEISLG